MINTRGFGFIQPSFLIRGKRSELNEWRDLSISLPDYYQRIFRIKSHSSISSNDNQLVPFDLTSRVYAETIALDTNLEDSPFRILGPSSRQYLLSWHSKPQR